MRPFKRKSTVEKALDSVVDALDGVDVPDAVKKAGQSGKPLKAGVLAVGGLAGLTAASAAVSSLRRRQDDD